jgi:hypothetical protein
MSKGAHTLMRRDSRDIRPYFKNQIARELDKFLRVATAVAYQTTESCFLNR